MVKIGYGLGDPKRREWCERGTNGIFQQYGRVVTLSFLQGAQDPNKGVAWDQFIPCLIEGEALRCGETFSVFHAFGLIGAGAS